MRSLEFSNLRLNRIAYRMEIRQRSKQEELDRRKVIRVVMLLRLIMVVMLVMLIMVVMVVMFSWLSRLIKVKMVVKKIRVVWS